MSRRRRWTPVKGTGSRIYHPAERALVAALDLPGRLVFGFADALGLRRRPADVASVRDVLVLRLDRIGDVLMSLPALADLRAALPRARIRLAVGSWSAEAAASAPVDEVQIWSAPWAGRAAEGAESLAALAARARALRTQGLDLALDLQGDIRASLLLWLTGARVRAGYANTGGAYLLTRVLPLDESVSWVDQNRRAVAAVVGEQPGAGPSDPLTASERTAGRRLLEALGIADRRPLVAIHPSGGRRVKQWDAARWGEVARRLRSDFGATILVSGSAADRPLATSLAEVLAPAPVDLTGRLSVREAMAVIAACDLFLSPDTGPMHMACAVDTPSVSIFGPSDPTRYFSGGSGSPGTRHVVVRAELWCSPCNQIRRPPRECAGPAMPECLERVSVDAVYDAAAGLLRERRASGPERG
jgi:ADP-heptose:LPS heptosyltransferase